MSVFLSVMVAGILTDNILLSGLLGFTEATNPDRSILEILKKCGFTAVLVFLSSLISYPLVKWVLIPLGLDILTPLICVLVICGICFAAFILTKKYLPSVYKIIDHYKSVITCSALVLGICMKVFTADYVSGFGTAVLYSVAAMVGFLLVSVIFWGIRDFLNSEALPRSLRGLPMTLLAAALLSMAFQGFVGM